MEAHDQSARRALLYSLLGDLPPRDRPLSAETVSVEEHEGYVLETLILDLNGMEAVPAYFVRPAECSAPRPALLYNHYHGGAYHQGKRELIEPVPLMATPPYAVELTRRGWCVLCVDHWCFGERRGRSESETFKHMLWHGHVLWGMMVYDSLRAVDWLVSRPEVDPARLGTLGLSMGSTMAWWAAALDPRLRVCVDLCCLTDYQALLETGGLDGHGLYYYVPGLLKHFSTAQVNALIAPRAHLSLAGNYDALTPPAGLERIDAELRRVYAQAGAPEAWRLVRYDHGHFETPIMRREVLAWLDRWL